MVHAQQPQPQQGSSGSRTATAGPSRATRTTTEPAEHAPSAPAPAILRLRGQNTSNGRSVQWDENVVDNEGLGRKSSKVCCIYHKPKAVDESSDDSSDSDSDSDANTDSDASDGGRAARGDADRRPTRPARNAGGGTRRRQHTHAADCEHTHDHEHDAEHDHDTGGDDGGDRGRRSKGKGKGKARRKPSPNAYEKMPKYKKSA